MIPRVGLAAGVMNVKKSTYRTRFPELQQQNSEKNLFYKIAKAQDVSPRHLAAAKFDLKRSSASYIFCRLGVKC